MWHSIVHHSFALPCMRVLARKQVISTNGQRQEALSPLPQTSIIFYLLRNTNPEGGHGPTCRLKKGEDQSAVPSLSRHFQGYRLCRKEMKHNPSGKTESTQDHRDTLETTD
jgi:hypothetical protein